MRSAVLTGPRARAFLQVRLSGWLFKTHDFRGRRAERETRHQGGRNCDAAGYRESQRDLTATEAQCGCGGAIWMMRWRIVREDPGP